MWKLGDRDASKLGVAVWTDSHGSWSLNGSGGECGVSLVAGDMLSGDDAPTWFRFEAVDQEYLPVANEHYVRGDELHVHYPQKEGIFGLRLVLQPIHSTPSHLVLEATIAVQTSLLDTHPKVDVIVDSSQTRDLKVKDLEVVGGAPPISFSTSETATTAVLLGPHDAPFTSDQSNAQQVNLRLFGDFLEKGVIRKARPWLVVDRDGSMTDSQLIGLWGELADSPLPLQA